MVPDTIKLTNLAPRGRPAAQYISQTFTLAAPNLSINGFDLDPRAFPAAYLDHAPSSSPSSPSSPSSSSPNTRSSRSRRRRQQKQQQDAGPEVRYEPFDGRKRLRVEELAREEEDLMREVAALKRRVPPAAARAYADGLRDGVRADEEALARARAVAAGLDGGGGNDEDENDRPAGEDGGGAKGASGSKKRKTTLLDGMGPLERQAGVERGYGGLVETLSRLKRDMPATVAKMERARVAGQYVVTER